jgi:large subunit ribosomal protein L24
LGNNDKRMKIKKGDTVQVMSGKDKGKSGVVERVIAEDGKIVIDGVNVRKKHFKVRRSGEKGQIIDIAMPIDASNVMLIDPKTKKPTRVGYKVDGGKKVRVAKKSGSVIA